MNLGLAVSRWHRYPKLAFTSGTDEMFIQKKSNVLEDVYGNYSVEPANQTRFPCERKIWGDGCPTTILKAAAPIFLQFGSHVQHE